MGNWSIFHADILKWIAEGGAKTLYHAVFCDPPYNLDSIKKRFGKKGSAPARTENNDGSFSRISRGFMGKEWDSDIAFNPAVWEGIKQFLYPGAIGMAFSGSRTYHKLASAIEEAGYIIHPMIGWINSQGMPKYTRVNRFTDDPAWDGYAYGTQALKPCLEPICVFQKPYEGKPIDSITETGAGTFWYEGGKFDVGREFTVNTWDVGAKPFGNGAGNPYTSRTESELFPANVVLTGDIGMPYENFFYNPKISTAEKEAGLDGIKERYSGMSGGAQSKGAGYDKAQSIGLNRVTKKRNHHPTVKPIALNEYLSKLILPPDKYAPRKVLVPFSGVASEMIGCLKAGWDVVHGVELDKDNEYIDVAVKRLDYWTAMSENV